VKELNDGWEGEKTGRNGPVRTGGRENLLNNEEFNPATGPGG